MVKSKYYNCDYVLDANDFEEVEFYSHPYPVEKRESNKQGEK